MKVPHQLAVVPISLCGASWGIYWGMSSKPSSNDIFIGPEGQRAIAIVMLGTIGFFVALFIGALVVKFSPKICREVSIITWVLACIPVGLYMVAKNAEAKEAALVEARDAARDATLKKNGKEVLDEFSKVAGFQASDGNGGWQGKTYTLSCSADQEKDHLIGIGAVERTHPQNGIYTLDWHRNGHYVDAYISTFPNGEVKLYFTFHN